MKITVLKGGLLAAMLCACAAALAQRPILIHSHNDYCRRVPFYQAYAQGVYSIEADLFLHEGQLLVGHDPEDLASDMTFEGLYVEPIVTLYARNGGRAWRGSDEALQLVIELKSETVPTLDAVTEVLSRYPEVFDPAVNPHAVRIAVTGRVPEPADFDKWPAWVRFDGRWDADYTPEQVAERKMEKGDGSLTLRLRRTKDIAAELGARKGGRLLVGFALETHDEEAHAEAKLERKNFDFVVLNSLRDAGAGFRGDTNKVTFIDRTGREALPLLSKSETAARIVDKIESLSK